MFRWIKEKYNDLKERWIWEWVDLTPNRFRHKIDNIIEKLMICIIVTLFASSLQSLALKLTGVPYAIYFFLYPVATIIIPLLVMTICMMWLAIYVGKFRSYLDDRVITYWTSSRVDRLRHYFDFTNKTLYYITFFLFGLILFPFIGELMPNINVLHASMSMGYMAIDLILPLCIIQVPLGIIVHCISRWYRGLMLEEMRRVYERQDRTTGSMPDNASEDEILDMKLSRMGL